MNSDIQKIEQKNDFFGISFCGYENMEKYPIYMSKNTFKRYVYWFFIDRKRSQRTLCFCQRF